MGVGICEAQALLVAVVLVKGAKVAFILGILGVVTNAVGGNRDVDVGAVGTMVGVGAVDWGANAGEVEATFSRIVDRGVATAAKKGVTRGVEDAGVDTGAAGGTKDANRNGALVVVVADIAEGVTFAKRGIV